MAKCIECTRPRVNGFCIIMICQCWFIACNKCATLVKGVDSPGVLRGGGAGGRPFPCKERQGVYGNSVLSALFCYEPQITLKFKSIFKKSRFFNLLGNSVHLTSIDIECF